MAIDPNSTIYLCNVPLDNRYINQVTWSRASQLAYFPSTAIYEIPLSSYQRKDNVIRAPYHIDALWNVNYLFYINTQYTSLYFFAFITQKVYINDTMTALYFETDVWQTWQYNVTLKRSFIEREHCQQYINGLPVLNTTSEGIDYGDSYDVVRTENVDQETDYLWLIGTSISLLKNAGSTSNPIVNGATGGIYAGIISAIEYYVIGGEYSDPLYLILNSISDKPWITQGIYFLSYVPRTALAGTTITPTRSNVNDTTGELPFLIGVLGESTVPPQVNITFNNIYDSFPNYKNSKLKLFPYSYIEITNYTGQNLVIHPQNLKNSNGEQSGTLELVRRGIFHTTPRVNYTVARYNQGGSGTGGESVNMSFTNDNFVQLPLQLDSQALTLANSAYQSQAQWFASGLTTAGGIVTGNPGVIIGGLSSLFDLALKTNTKEKIAETKAPGLVGNIKENPLLLAYGFNGITVKWKTIKEEYRVINEEYFERYGYKVGINKVPNLGQYHDNFYYLKTNGAVVQGGIDQNDLIKIANMFDNGVTIYPSPLYIGNI